MAQMVKNLLAMQETLVQSLAQEDFLEKEMATLVFLPRKSHGQRSLGGLQSMGPQKVGRNLATKPPSPNHV